MTPFSNFVEWTLGIILILSALGVIVARQPVHAALSFLLTLLTLAALYLQLSASFIAVMQVIAYAGAILVLFMFVIMLFQDAYQNISEVKSQSMPLLLWIAGSAFLMALIYLATKLTGLTTASENVPADYGTVEAIGKALYIQFFFPFEAVILLFLISVVGSLYIARKER